MRPSPLRMGNMRSVIRVMQPLSSGNGDDPVIRKRRLVADLCRLLGAELSSAGPGQDLSPRLQQTLRKLLAGDSEKQIARALGLSPHTVHVYVKQLYKHYGVSSRGELLARWVRK